MTCISQSESPMHKKLITYQLDPLEITYFIMFLSMILMINPWAIIFNDKCLIMFCIITNPVLEYSTKLRTGFSKVKIMRTAHASWGCPPGPLTADLQ